MTTYITDRTIEDVQTANALRKLIQNGTTLTDEQKSQFLRGTCTIDMLNRIETATQSLYTKLKENGYIINTQITTKTWTYSSICNQEDMERILSNISYLREHYFINDTTPSVPIYLYGWEQANATEKNLYDIESLVTSMLSNIRYCGTFQCGEEIT